MKKKKAEDYTDQIIGFAVIGAVLVGLVSFFSSCSNSWNEAQQETDCILDYTLKYVPAIQDLEDQGRDNAARRLRNQAHDEAKRICD